MSTYLSACRHSQSIPWTLWHLPLDFPPTGAESWPEGAPLPHQREEGEASVRCWAVFLSLLQYLLRRGCDSAARCIGKEINTGQKWWSSSEPHTTVRFCLQTRSVCLCTITEPARKRGKRPGCHEASTKLKYYGHSRGANSGSPFLWLRPLCEHIYIREGAWETKRAQGWERRQTSVQTAAQRHF